MFDEPLRMNPDNLMARTLGSQSFVLLSRPSFWRDGYALDPLDEKSGSVFVMFLLLFSVCSFLAPKLFLDRAKGPEKMSYSVD